MRVDKKTAQTVCITQLPAGTKFIFRDKRVWLEDGRRVTAPIVHRGINGVGAFAVANAAKLQSDTHSRAARQEKDSLAEATALARQRGLQVGAPISGVERKALMEGMEDEQD